jgi:hypothetical protein
MYHPVFYLIELFGVWSLSPTSGKNLLSWAESTEVAPASGDRDVVLNKKQDNG